jgi:hypothetical protein
MFLNYKTDQLKNINELRKQGKNKEADQIEAESEKNYLNH